MPGRTCTCAERLGPVRHALHPQGTAVVLSFSTSSPPRRRPTPSRGRRADSAAVRGAPPLADCTHRASPSLALPPCRLPAHVACCSATPSLDEGAQAARNALRPARPRREPARPLPMCAATAATDRCEMSGSLAALPGARTAAGAAVLDELPHGWAELYRQATGRPLRHAQACILSEVARGHDVVGIAATGSGKGSIWNLVAAVERRALLDGPTRRRGSLPSTSWSLRWPLWERHTRPSRATSFTTPVPSTSRLRSTDSRAASCRAA